MQAEGAIADSCELRQVKYLNNIVDQDHRFIKRRVKPGLGFFSFETAWNTLHALRKFIFFANEGKIRQSQDDAQTNQAGSLNLMTNAVVTWNTVYMQQAVNQLKAEGHPINEADLKYLSPARHVHINPYGKYEFNVEEELNRKSLRPLRKG